MQTPVSKRNRESDQLPLGIFEHEAVGRQRGHKRFIPISQSNQPTTTTLAQKRIRSPSPETPSRHVRHRSHPNKTPATCAHGRLIDPPADDCESSDTSESDDLVTTGVHKDHLAAWRAERDLFADRHSPLAIAKTTLGKDIPPSSSGEQPDNRQSSRANGFRTPTIQWSSSKLRARRSCLPQEGYLPRLIPIIDIPKEFDRMVGHRPSVFPHTSVHKS
jgi:hypothetical protein